MYALYEHQVAKTKLLLLRYFDNIFFKQVKKHVQYKIFTLRLLVLLFSQEHERYSVLIGLAKTFFSSPPILLLLLLLLSHPPSASSSSSAPLAFLSPRADACLKLNKYIIRFLSALLSLLIPFAQSKVFWNMHLPCMEAKFLSKRPPHCVFKIFKKILR